jgi:putative phage-type endonuclease
VRLVLVRHLWATDQHAADLPAVRHHRRCEPPAQGRPVTAVLNADTDRDAWLAARRLGIGASEIAAVLGISPWESPFSLYWRKVEGWEVEETAQMEWGTRLEPAIAAAYADRHPDDLVILGVLVEGPEPWMLATPDRLIAVPTPEELRCMRYPDDVEVPPTVVGVLELKTAHSAHDGWGESGTAEIPVHYRAQVQWQMLVCDVEWAVVAVLIGGSDYREYPVLRDERDLRVMVEAGRRFMARIEAGDPPTLDDHEATLSTLVRLHPDMDDDTVEVDEAAAAGYLRAVRTRKLAERLEDRYAARLRDQMGRARWATAGGRKVATRVISDVAESVRKAHRRDYLLAPRSPK